MSGRRLGFGLFTLVMVALFVGLGIWQLQRRHEKHALIAALTERLAAAPAPLPPAAEWSKLAADRDEFGRVSFTATYESRLSGEVRRKRLTVFKLTPDTSDWEGDPAQWGDVFKQYFS